MTTPPLVSVADHPRAGAMIRRAKTWGGIGGFLIVALASYAHGAMLFDALLRGLAGGAVCYFVVWRAALGASRRLLKAQAQSAVEHALERRREAAAKRAANTETFMA